MLLGLGVVGIILTFDSREVIKKFHLSGRFGILLNEKFSGVAEQGYKMLYGKSYIKPFQLYYGEKQIG